MGEAGEEAQGDLTLGAVTPPTFQCQDVVASLSTEHLTLSAEQDGRGGRPPFMCVLSELGGCVLPAMCAGEHHQRREASGPTQTLTGKSVLSLVLSETGGFESATGADGQSRAPIGASVCVGRLQLGRQGPVAQLSLDGFTDVRVDHSDSPVRCPFVGGCTLSLCQAYDELVRLVLTTPLVVDDCLDDYEDVNLQRSCPESGQLALLEISMLQTIAEAHGLSVRRRPASPLAIRSWLVYHAKLLFEGTSFRLLDSYAYCGDYVLPWTCHAQSLQGALLWVAITYQGKLFECCPGLVERDSSSSQVELVHFPLLLLCLSFTRDSSVASTVTLGIRLLQSLPHSLFVGPCLL